MTRCAWVFYSVLVALAACGDGGDGEGGSDDGSSGSDDAAESSDDGVATTVTTAGSGNTTASTTDDGTGGVGEAEAMCMHWLAERTDLGEGAWSGDVASCMPGDIAADARVRSLGLINLFRALAELPAITSDPARDANAQACALMMDAADTLSHTPTPDWACYTTEGAEAAGSSNIATTGAVAAVDLYMIDPGNPDTLGHRRWILSNSIGPTGIGSTDAYSCMYTLGGTGNAGAAWVAYPTPGPFPLAATTLGWTDLDETGWSIQSDGIDLGGASVTITRGGETLPVALHVLGQGYGSMFAISMIPMGWTTSVGAYHVRVDGVAQPIEYDVEIVDCV
jgi:uncharacterized protein YkwD